MFQISIIISITAIFVSVICYSKLLKEMKRNRILQSFISGTIDKVCQHDRYIDSLSIAMEKISPDFWESHSEYNPYKNIIESVKHEFEEDFWVNPLKKFIKEDRNLFWDNKLANGGFTQLYSQFYNVVFKESFYINNRKESDSSGIDIEIAGEKLIYEKLMKNEVTGLIDKIPKDIRFFFNHLNEDEINNLMKKYKFSDLKNGLS